MESLLGLSVGDARDHSSISEGEDSMLDKADLPGGGPLESEDDENELTTLSSFQTALRYNPMTLHTGTFLADVVVHSSSDESLESDQCSYLSGRRGSLYSTILPPHVEDSVAGEPYVFEEDDLSSCCRRVSIRPEPARVREKETPFKAWEEHNVKRGRLVAKSMLNSPRRLYRSDGDTASTSMSDDGFPSPKLVTGRGGTKPSLFLGKLLDKKKVFTKSPSPLDQTLVMHDLMKKHRISQLAVSAISESQMQLLSPDSVLARNSLVDFGRWEAVLSKQQNDSDIDCVETETKEPEWQEHDGLKEATPGPEKSPPRTVPIRTISILQSSHDIFLGSKQIASTKTSPLETSLGEQLEKERTTPEDVASFLGIETEGFMLLDHMRARAGIIEDLADNSCPAGTIPWLYLFDDFWMPHYEEYVVRSVHDYSRQLRQREASRES